MGADKRTECVFRNSRKNTETAQDEAQMDEEEMNKKNEQAGGQREAGRVERIFSEEEDVDVGLGR